MSGKTEVKLVSNGAGGGIIDLSTHKNNIRLKHLHPLAEQQAVESASVPASSTAEDKKKIKCRYWPKCKETDDKCPYFHPKEECKFFPNCQNGQKCLYIHPEV